MQQLAVPRYAPRPQPTIIPTAAWTDAPLFCLAVNDEWVSHILGVMTALDQPDTWIGTEDEIYAARQQVNEIMLALMTTCEEPVSVQYPQHATLFHDESTVLSGAALTVASDAANFYHVYAYQASGANGDSFSQLCALDAGDYVFHVLGGGSNLCGKIDWYLDDDMTPFLSGQDWYTSAATPNIFQTGTLTIATAGRHTLKGVMNGKNGSSFAYVAPLTKYWFEYVP